ncbi:ribonuclease PH [Cloacibacillus sp. An23]|uniref:ribonuclease PH n=1 Tax=Cloacibacillus sp. An23 TaxID=1965591 RepID=UPI000B3698AB|nr:ribonuclease PH [Cloacibacillus sp. An23]OUO94129.1 ribonuclease PH [Cloacibacillus sp. An23]
MEAARIDGRAPGGLRPITIERGVNRYAEGSALIRWGDTHVLCTATVEEKVPPFLRGSGSGWITAEYAMLPRSTQSRMQREINRGKRDARGSEIQRLIGRSLRAAVDMPRLGERTITIDCDVLQADGGTRTASISAGFVALFDALRTLKADGRLAEIPLKDQIAAVSVGKSGGALVLDLRYEEDSSADVDANVVMTGRGGIVEIQGTGEGAAFSRAELGQMLDLAASGIAEIQRRQLEVLGLTEDERRLFETCA